jgi:hypothetical protein
VLHINAVATVAPVEPVVAPVVASTTEGYLRENFKELEIENGT